MAHWLTDPEAVADEYASEEALRERLFAFSELAEGKDDEEVVRQRILAARPGRLLDVGSGLGDLCGWAKAELDAEVVAVDSSPRMVELAAQAGIDGGPGRHEGAAVRRRLVRLCRRELRALPRARPGNGDCRSWRVS